jgi:cyclopropane-fatty-acyl-phospholipid synthase
MAWLSLAPSALTRECKRVDNRDYTVLQGSLSHASRVRQLVEQVFQGYTGCFSLRLWNGEAFTLGRGAPAATVIFNTSAPFRDMVLRRDPLRLAEGYLLGEVDVEGDFYALLRQRDHLKSLTLPFRTQLALFAVAVRLGNEAPHMAPDGSLPRWSGPTGLPLSHKASMALYRDAISFHYDVSNEFYRLWLDEQMVYSCAYFDHADASLDLAQRAKLDYICRKLRLRPEERLLDIGCGWGALICWAARHYGVFAHGITLSSLQFEYARAKILELKLEDRVTVELRDYRDLREDAAYDKVASIGMFEHVGIRNFPLYFNAARRALKPGGLFLNHGITNDEEGWRKHPTAEFMRRYVFPEGELDTVSNVQREMERAHFEILDVEALRPHYALTLRHWVTRLEARHEQAIKQVGEARYRVWRLYMAAAALQFEQGGMGLYQILAANRRDGLAEVPLTRRSLYA